MSVDIQPEIFYIQCPVILGCLATDDIWTSQIVGRVSIGFCGRVNEPARGTRNSINPGDSPAQRIQCIPHGDPRPVGIPQASSLFRSSSSLQRGHISVPRRSVSLLWQEEPEVCMFRLYAGVSIADLSSAGSSISPLRRPKSWTSSLQRVIPQHSAVETRTSVTNLTAKCSKWILRASPYSSTS